MSEKELDVDFIISSLLEAQFHPPGTEIVIPEEQITYLIEAVIDIFMKQPVLLELEAPIKLCGSRFNRIFIVR